MIVFSFIIFFFNKNQSDRSSYCVGPGFVASPISGLYGNSIDTAKTTTLHDGKTVHINARTPKREKYIQKKVHFDMLHNDCSIICV